MAPFRLSPGRLRPGRVGPERILTLQVALLAPSPQGVWQLREEFALHQQWLPDMDSNHD